MCRKYAEKNSLFPHKSFHVPGFQSPVIMFHCISQTLVHVYLVSKRAEERRDAAKHLGLLRCGDAMVFFALKERLRIDEDLRTKYEAAKSLVLLGV